jgi:hypothetical protein
MGTNYRIRSLHVEESVACAQHEKNGIDENHAPYPFSSLPQRPITLEVEKIPEI